MAIVSSQAISPVIDSHQSDSSLDAKERAADNVRQLMAAFDAFCTRAGADYFAIGDTLVGVFYYHDLIPGESHMQVGMLRGAFQRLQNALAEQDEKPASTTLSLSFQCKGPAAAQVRSRLLESGKAPLLNHSQDSSQQESPFFIELHVFDALTDDYDLSRFQVWIVNMKRKAGGLLGGRLGGLLLQQAEKTAARYESTSTHAVSNLHEKDAHSIPRSDVAHTQRMPFTTGSISVPALPDYWVETDLEEVRRRTRSVQADLLLILSEIDRVCRAYNIGYFLCAGTLLGAVRYDGFIPWDDDADLGMLRPDYDRFTNCAQEYLGERFFVQTIRNEPDAPYLYAKVRLNGTEYVTHWLGGHDLHTGISVDIFPFDLAPVGEPDFDEHLAKANRLARDHKSLANHRVSAEMPHRKAKGPWEHVGHVVMAALHARYRLKSSQKTAERYRAHVSQFNGSLGGGCIIDTSFTSNEQQRGSASTVVQGDKRNARNEEEIIRIKGRGLENKSTTRSMPPRYVASYVAYFTYLGLDDLLPYREIRFENLTLLAPANPDALMTMQFDDYQQEPPLHQRRGHPVLHWRTSDGSCG